MKVKKFFKITISIIVFIALFNPFSLKFYYEFLRKNFDSKSTYSDEEEIEIYSSGQQVDESDISKLEGSKLTGENYGFDTKYYPYFGMLNDNEKKLYKQIYANANEIVETFLPVVNISVDEVKNTFEALYNDHPELFWLNTSYSYKYTESKKCVQVILNYNDTAKDIKKSTKIFNEKVDSIINNAKKYKTNYEREKYVHDYLVKNIKYDKNAKMNQSAYSALINKKTICAGYARAFQYIMIKLEIPTYYVVGVSNVNHAWNMVLLDDGYYNVDLTWDNSDLNRYKYFNKTDKDFSKTHTRTGLSLNLPECNATKYRNRKDLLSNKNNNTPTITVNIKSNSNVVSNSQVVSNKVNNKNNKSNKTSNIDKDSNNITSNNTEEVINKETIDNSVNDDEVNTSNSNIVEEVNNNGY